MPKETILQAMEAAGYFFDDINSYDGWLVFNGEYCDKIEFLNFEEVLDWLENVVFEDDETLKNVGKILHPEMF